MKAKHVVFAAVIVLAGGAVAAGAAAAYYWNRATALPTWYTGSTVDGDLTTTVSSSTGLLQTKLASGEGVRYGSNNQVEITLTEADLNQLIVEGLNQTPSTSQLLEVAQGVNASIEGDQLRAGVVVNPSSLPLGDLPPETQATVQQAFETMPMLRDRNVYFGIEGNPRIENGQVMLGDNTHLRIGNIRLSMAEVSRLTGLNPEQLAEQVNIVLPQAGIAFDGIEFVNDEAILRGTIE
jgi:hypothetical protein